MGLGANEARTFLIRGGGQGLSLPAQAVSSKPMSRPARARAEFRSGGLILLWWPHIFRETALIICIAEDRRSFEPSVKLLLLSLARHSPALRVHLIFPPASAEFISWLKSYSNVTLNRTAVLDSSGLNIKPTVMLSLMEAGNNEVVWIDSDIIVLEDISPIFQGLGLSTFVVTEEALSGRYYDYGGERARRWGFAVGRTLPFAVNTGIIRATTAHRALLERWRDLLASSPYREAQRLDWRVRPWHLLTDQDVLTALLSVPEFSGIPIKALKRGKDIIQYFGPRGYTVAERTLNILGYGPKFVHSQGPKPWAHHWEGVRFSRLGEYLRAIYLDLSPYTLAAQKYRSKMDGEADWMDLHFTLSKIFRLMGFWYLPLVGLPLAIIWDVYEPSKKILSKLSAAGKSVLLF